ncbi:MAG: quinol:cytochrome C oxidoreductase [Flavobacteriia bacterium]|nr:quinol:cytochrome C oxidoreductase [Flavobacteriia bacterium]
MALGIVCTIVGVVLEMGHDHGHHLPQRLSGNLLINSFFFFGIAIASLFFLALKYATETAWYVAIKRVIEGVAGFLPFGVGLLLITFAYITLNDGAHIYLWMDEEIVKHDEIIQGKAFYLSKTFFWIRTLVYVTIYLLYYWGFRKRSLLEDQVGGTELHYKNYKKGATFLVFFAVFSSTSAWDWIMSIDVHWFSTLFGWYVFSGMWCTAMIVMVILTLYLKRLGHLERVNENHIHDIGKWVFAISFLWSYLWFSQFMLIWFANIPEETTYFVTRIAHFKVLYFGMFLINFVFPMVLLMSRDAKRHSGLLIFVGLIVFFGHWMDTYIMVMGGSMGENASIGFMEIGLLLLILGLFVRVILTSLTKAPLDVKNHPYLEESIHHEV